MSSKCNYILIIINIFHPSPLKMTVIRVELGWNSITNSKKNVFFWIFFSFYNYRNNSNCRWWMIQIYMCRGRVSALSLLNFKRIIQLLLTTCMSIISFICTVYLWVLLSEKKYIYFFKKWFFSNKYNFKNFFL